MEKFKNVTIEKKANVYLEGKIISHTIIFNSGEKKTLGIMMPGEYEFNTCEKEIIEVLDGRMMVLLPKETEWKLFHKGEVFEISGNSNYKLAIGEVTEYCCSLIESA